MRAFAGSFKNPPQQFTPSKIFLKVVLKEKFDRMAATNFFLHNHLKKHNNERQPIFKNTRVEGHHPFVDTHKYTEEFVSIKNGYKYLVAGDFVG